MKRRVHEGRPPAAAPQEPQEEPAQPLPRRGVRVAGEVRDREVTELQRIAGVLEVTTWIKRIFPRSR